MQYLITVSSEIQIGNPVFYNTRVPVKNPFDYLKGGDSIDDFLEDFPSVEREQALRILEFAEHSITLKGIAND